jgi:replicative DNA helicase
MGKIFKKIYGTIQKNKQLKREGKVTTITPPFPRLAKVYPGWDKGMYTILTASSGIGKTKFTKFMTVMSVFRFIKLNPEVKVKVKYFALEETEEDFWLSFLSMLLYQKYSISISVPELKSKGEHTISDDVEAKVLECEKLVDEIEEHVEVIDYIFNGFGIYKHVREFFENPAIGSNITKLDKDGKPITIGYKHNFPDTYYFVVVDQINLLIPDTIGGVKQNDWEAMSYFSKEYVLKGFCKRYNCVAVILQQQEAAKEKAEYYKGEIIIEKLEPSLDGLGNNKETQRDADLVIGLFAPDRYGLKEHRGYDITKLGDRYRSLKFLKDRHYGLANVYVPLQFDGASSTFIEMDKIK